MWNDNFTDNINIVWKKDMTKDWDLLLSNIQWQGYIVHTAQNRIYDECEICFVIHVNRYIVVILVVQQYENSPSITVFKILLYTWMYKAYQKHYFSHEITHPWKQKSLFTN